MQYYHMETIGDPAPAHLAAIREISAAAAEILAGREHPTLRYRMVALGAGADPRLVVDVDVGGTVLPIDFGTWATYADNRRKAAEFVAARTLEIGARQDAVLAHLAGLRSRVEAVLARTQGIVDFVDLRFWPIEGSARFGLRELRLELTVEQFGGDLARRRESYHGYGIRELTGCIRQDLGRQRRMAELRLLLDEARVEADLDRTAQIQLAEGRTSPRRIAERIVADARRTGGAG